MKKLLLVVCMIILSCALVQAQKSAESAPSKPKLVIGIVVDQMAYDFLYRYWDNYSEGGFKKLVKEGYSCENTHYNYIPTYTGPGHASIYTGSVPAIHGIVSNDWYDRYSNTGIYCAADNTVQGVGTSSLAGQMSPRNMLTTTICDELKLFNNMQSKVIGIALKDRGAILTAGHTADAAYWYDGYNNAWVTSNYYMQTLPQWVTDFNAKNKAAVYMQQTWNLLLSADTYRNSTIDNVPWEGVYAGEATPTFPHVIPVLPNTEPIKGLPYGNTFTADFAKAAITNENLGKDNYTDFLALSFSSTDYVGHRYGNYSLEIEDTYIRFDRDLADFITFLDTQVGKGNYIIFLTADHGVAPTPGYMKSLKIPAGIFSETVMQTNIERAIDSLVGNNNWVKSYMNQNIYLNDSALQATNKNIEQVLSAIKPYLLKQEGIANAYVIDKLSKETLQEKYKQMFINGMYAKRSGDILIQYEPNWMDAYGETGSTHGAHYSYDTHVPLIWYGWGIPAGKSFRTINITDIAPTIAAMLHIREPNGCIGNVITEMK
ncbi:MAG: alkaline phosphatase family protein [Chitinophagales bacterium]|nr:alkaline phosphatase family protein [Chitinophagales bacterium]